MSDEIVMRTWVFHWRDGHVEALIGDTAAHALDRAGYGRGALPALDYYEERTHE